MPSSRCKQCDQPLIEIDHYGERLAGCHAVQPLAGFDWRMLPTCTRYRCAPCPESLEDYNERLPMKFCSIIAGRAAAELPEAGESLAS